VHVKGFTNLQGLHLNFTGVTDAGLVHLKGMTNLQSLGLSYLEVAAAFRHTCVGPLQARCLPE